MLSTYATSAIRTLVPYLVGWLLSLSYAVPVEHALHVTSASARSTLSGLLIFAVGTLYYLIVRAVEHVEPSAGFLLGVPVRPAYPPSLAGADKAIDQLGAAAIASVAGAQLVNDDPPTHSL